jgi:hypothetical protein
MQCEWDTTMFPWVDMSFNWSQSFGEQSGHELRFELRDSLDGLVKNARLKFTTLYNDVGSDYYDDEQQEWITGSHIATFNAECKGMPTASCSWEFDWGQPPRKGDGAPPGPVSEWSGFRLYWFPYVPGPFTPPTPPPVRGAFGQDTPDVGLMFWPAVDWSWVRSVP